MPGAKKVIVGIGNPGDEYAGTRHNVGWRVLDRLAKDDGLSFKTRSEELRSASGRIAGRDALLVKPLTYVNLTGRILAPLRDQYVDSKENLMIVCDEIQLPLGALRVRPKGGAGGHNGLASVIGALGTEEFPRLRVGVGREGLTSAKWSDYVLSRFDKMEEAEVDRAVARAADAVRLWLSRGLEACMNETNRREEKDE